MYLHFVIFTALICCCVCFSYETFDGFNETPALTPPFDISDVSSLSTTTVKRKTSIQHKLKKAIPKTKLKRKLSTTIETTSKTTPTTKTLRTKTTQRTTKSHPTTTPPATNIPSTTSLIPLMEPVMPQRFNCSEDEVPFNIGPYEVPTQRDMAKLIQRTLILSFNRYQEKALCFLKDIHKATQATSAIEQKCRPSRKYRMRYKTCVSQVSNTCKTITKSFVVSLEKQRSDVSAFIEGTICNVTEMKADPLQLIKTLAMEQAALEFALPGFLRLLGACSLYCEKKLPKSRKMQPLRHMTDQDLVVKHFLTKKSYFQLMKGSK